MKPAARLRALFLCLLPGLAFSAPKTGDIHVTAVIVDFSNSANQQSPSKVRGYLCDDTTSTRAVFHASSGGKLRLTCSVVGPVKIPSTNAGCNYTTWSTQASAELRKQGVAMPTGGAQLVSYVYPGNGCPARGYAYISGSLSHLVQGAHPNYSTHELGHNLGFHHGSALGSEYGDSGDFMGGANNQTAAAPNRVDSGWLNPSAVIKAAPGVSRHTIYALDSFSIKPQVVIADTIGVTERVYVSFRQAVGLDARLKADFLNVVSVHDRNSPLKIGSLSPTMRRGQLAAGQAFVNKEKNYRVSVLSIGPDSAEVEVEYTGLAGCKDTTPSMTVDGPAEVVQGGAVRYTYTVKSTAPAACISQDFTIKASGGPSLAGKALSTDKLRIRPGETAAFTLDVTVPAEQPVGTSTVQAQAWSSSSLPQTKKSTLRVVAGAAPIPPPPEPDPAPEPEPIPEPIPEPEPAPKDEPAPEPPPVTKPEPPPVQTGSATIIASADTYLSSYHPKNAWGTATTMMQGGSYQPLLRFAVYQSQGGPVPDGAQIVSAKVRVYKTTAYNLTLGLYRIGTDWSEASTLATSPGWADAPDAQGSVEWEPGWVEFDVTDSLASAPFGWRIGRIAGHTDAVFKRFASREGDPAQAPRLVVEWQ